MKTIFLAALEDETKGLNAFIFTGVGKINATFKTLDVINKYNPKKIVNFGMLASFISIKLGILVESIIQKSTRGLIGFVLIIELKKK